MYRLQVHADPVTNDHVVVQNQDGSHGDGDPSENIRHAESWTPLVQSLAAAELAADAAAAREKAKRSGDASSGVLKIFASSGIAAAALGSGGAGRGYAAAGGGTRSAGEGTAEMVAAAGW